MFHLLFCHFRTIIYTSINVSKLMGLLSAFFFLFKNMGLNFFFFLKYFFILFFYIKLTSSRGPDRIDGGPKLARGPLFADPCYKSTPLRPGRDFTSYVTRCGSLAGSACVRVAVCLRDLCTNGCVERDGGCVTFLQSVMIGYISTNDFLLLAIKMTKQHELS